MYTAQEGNLFCDNPRDTEGTLKIATCCEVRGMKPVEVAEVLANSLNAVKDSKDKASEKDEHLVKVYEYILATGIKCVPRFIWDEINKAYQI